MVENLNPDKGVIGKEIEVGRDGLEFLDAMSLSSFNLKKSRGKRESRYLVDNTLNVE
jgi:hypothetical protein